jgi:hypothetical protein
MKGKRSRKVVAIFLYLSIPESSRWKKTMRLTYIYEHTALSQTVMTLHVAIHFQRRR